MFGRSPRSSGEKAILSELPVIIAMASIRPSILSVSKRLRSPLQLLSRPPRRYASEAPKNTGHSVEKLEGVYDNAFNRERLAVKRHAAETAGTFCILTLGSFY